MLLIQRLDFRLMQKNHNNQFFQYLLVLFLSFALMLSQVNRLHMHLEHDDHSSVASGHVVNVHTTTLLHDLEPTGHHDDHHAAAIDVSTDNLINKVNSLNTLVLILLVAVLLLFKPRLTYACRQKPYRIRFIHFYYYLLPPLRAPPL